MTKHESGEADGSKGVGMVRALQERKFTIRGAAPSAPFGPGNASPRNGSPEKSTTGLPVFTTRNQVVESMKAIGLSGVNGHGGDEIGFRCPVHETRTGKPDKRPSASVNWRRGVWCCYGCGAKGSLRRLLGGARQTAAEVVKGLLGRAKTKAVHVKLPSDFKRLTAPNNYLLARGLTTRDVAAWGLGVAGDYVVFPAYVGRRLVGWQGRAMTYGREPRYCTAPGARDFLLGYDLARKRPGPLVVVEGPFDAVRVRQAGFAVVALAGSGGTARYEAIQRLAGRRVIVVLTDSDSAGQRAGQRLTMWFNANKRKAMLGVLPDGAKDPAECTPAQLRLVVRDAVAWIRKLKATRGMK